MATSIGTYATPASVKQRVGGTFDANDDNVLTPICDGINAFIEGDAGCGRVMAPVASAVYLYDGDGGRRVYVPSGVRSVSLLEAAWTTGSSFTTIPSADYVLRPAAQFRHPAMPAAWIELVDIPTGSFVIFPIGYSNIRVTMATGPVAIPDDLIDVANAVGVSAWHAHQLGMTQATGVDEQTPGQWVERLLSPQQRSVIRSYRGARMYGI